MYDIVLRNKGVAKNSGAILEPQKSQLKVLLKTHLCVLSNKPEFVI